MSFSFCLNKNELLLLAGFGLLYQGLFQGLNLDHGGKLSQDSQRLLCSVIEILERNAAVGAPQFKKVARAMISVERVPQELQGSGDITGGCKSDENTAAPPQGSEKPARKLQNTVSRLSTGSTQIIKRESSSGRRSTAPTLPTELLSYYDNSISQSDFPSVVSDMTSQDGILRCTTLSESSPHKPPVKPNLDYLSFNDSPPWPMSPRSSQQHNAPGTATKNVQPTLDSLFPSEDVFSPYASPPPSANFGWCSDIWAMSSDMSNQPDVLQGSVSFAEEDHTSGEELSSCDMGTDVRGLDGLVGLDALDESFGLQIGETA